jgi:steroid delta-isomerase
MTQTTVSQATIAQLIADYFLAIRTLDVEAWVACFAEDATDFDPVGGTPHSGQEAIRQFFLGIAGLFEAVGLTEEFVHIVGQEVAVKWTGRGVGKNGCEVHFEGIDLFEINDSGKIQTLRAYWNPAPLMAELQA